MTYITKINNIFLLLLDNLTRVIYNNISKMLLLRIFLVFFAFSLVFPSFMGADRAPENEASLLSVTLECSEEEGGIELSVSFPEGVRFCGFYCEILYDGRLCFEGASVSGGAPEGGQLSFADGGDRLALLLDGDGSVFCGERLVATFSFAGETVGEVCFELVSGDAYFWDEDVLVRLSVPPTSFACELGGAISEGEALFLPEIAEIRVEDGELCVVCLAPKGCFSAGVEVFSVSLSDAARSRYTLTSVLPLDEAMVSFAGLPQAGRGRYCVILRPVAYFRDGAVCGEKKIFLLIDGNLRGE